MLLKDLAKRGKAILLVEHRLDVVLPHVDAVWELRDGTARLIEDKNAYLGSQVSVIKDKKDDCLAAGASIIKATNITKQFKDNSVLKDISFELHSGERLLLGENGCGKSTLLSILARLIKPTDGKIEQFLEPRCGKRANKLWFKTVGVVYQNPNYQLFMSSVADELCFAADDKDYAMYLAERFGLTPLLERHPHSLSEGQKRRVPNSAGFSPKPQPLFLVEAPVGGGYVRVPERTALF